MVEFASTQVSGSGNVKTVSHGGDEQLFVEFYKNPSDKLDHIRIMIPGDKLFAPDYIADERYQRRFPKQWEAYKTQKDQFDGQTRLEELAWIDPATKSHYNSFGIFTLEGLSQVSDGNLSNLGPEARNFRERAKQEVDTMAKAAAFDKSEAEKEALQTQLAEMRAEIASLQPKKRGPGRPKKEEEEQDAA